MFAVDDEFTLRSAIERYEDIDISFGGSREHNLLIVCLAAPPAAVCCALGLAAMPLVSHACHSNHAKHLVWQDLWHWHMSSW